MTRREIALSVCLAGVLLLLLLGSFQSQTRLQNLEAKLASLEKRHADEKEFLKIQYQQEASLLTQGVGNFLKERDETRTERRQLEEEFGNAEARRRALLTVRSAVDAQFSKPGDADRIEITQSSIELRVRFAGDFLFRSGSSLLLSDGREVLGRLAKAAKGAGDFQFRVEGHTDDRPIRERSSGRIPSNWDLSTRRATAAVNYLQEECGVRPNRMVVIGMGESEPVESNETEKGRARNRRIEVALRPVLPAKLPAPRPAK